jgi:hypothetical protein
MITQQFGDVRHARDFMGSRDGWLVGLRSKTSLEFCTYSIQSIPPLVLISLFTGRFEAKPRACRVFDPIY